MKVQSVSFQRGKLSLLPKLHTFLSNSILLMCKQAKDMVHLLRQHHLPGQRTPASS